MKLDFIKEGGRTPTEQEATVWSPQSKNQNPEGEIRVITRAAITVLLVGQKKRGLIHRCRQKYKTEPKS